MKTQLTLKKLVVATAAALTVAFSPLMLDDNTAQAGFFIDEAVAAAPDNAGHKGEGMKGYKGGGEQGARGMRQGNKSISDILADESEEDSDRPPWAGVPGNEGKPGGGNAGGDTQKGGDYGDIVVMLRNDDGTLVQDGNTTYAVAPDGTLIPIVNGEIPEGADVQAVEFGRLNIARAPTKVLDHSLVEALSKLDGASLYLDEEGNLAGTITLDPAGRLVTADGFTIDSPLENLAIYQALLEATPDADGNLILSATTNHDGVDTTYVFTVDADIRLDLAASAIAAASDKTGELTIDEVVGISSFVGVDDELANLVTSYSYDRTATYDGVQVWILVEDPATGNYVPTLVNLYTTVDWGTVEDNSIKDNVDGTGIDIFTQAADDAVQALEFVHDNAIDQ